MREGEIQVVADDRESRSDVIEQLRLIDGVSVQVERLPLGDYLVDGRLLFERKTIPDLVLSLIDGRLFSQACRLVSSELRPIYIVEGTSADLADCRMRREAIQGAIVTLGVIMGIAVLRSMDASETARLMVVAANQVQRQIKGGVHRAGYRPKGKRKRQLYVLQGLPGIGPERAERLLEAFGTLEDVFGAEEADLAEVPGIGKGTAEKIRRLVTESRARYG